MNKQTFLHSLCCLWLLLAVGCSPTVSVAPPDKPIVINMNIKIEHDIRIKMDKAVDELISKDSDLF